MHKPFGRRFWKGPQGNGYTETELKSWAAPPLAQIGFIFLRVNRAQINEGVLLPSSQTLTQRLEFVSHTCHIFLG